MKDQREGFGSSAWEGHVFCVHLRGLLETGERALSFSVRSRAVSLVAEGRSSQRTSQELSLWFSKGSAWVPGADSKRKAQKDKMGNAPACEPGGAVSSRAAWCVPQVPGQNVPLVETDKFYGEHALPTEKRGLLLGQHRGLALQDMERQDSLG